MGLVGGISLREEWSMGLRGKASSKLGIGLDIDASFGC